MNCRQLTIHDAPALAALRLNALQESPDAFASSYEEECILPLSHFEERLLPMSSSITFGVFQQNELVGMATVVRSTKMKMRHRADIVSVYISPGVRGQGAGRLLFTGLFHAAGRIAGVEQLYLSVSSHNKAAKALYESLGFNVYATEKHALKLPGRYVDIDLMVYFCSDNKKR